VTLINLKVREFIKNFPHLLVGKKKKLVECKLMHRADRKQVRLEREGVFSPPSRPAR